MATNVASPLVSKDLTPRLNPAATPVGQTQKTKGRDRVDFFENADVKYNIGLSMNQRKLIPSGGILPSLPGAY